VSFVITPWCIREGNRAGLDIDTSTHSRASKFNIQNLHQFSYTDFFHASFGFNTPSTMAFHQNTGSSTCVIEPPIELEPISQPAKSQDAKVMGSRTSLRLSDTKGIQDDDSPMDLPSPTTHPAEKAERWNHPRSNLFRTMAAFWSFVVMGSNDAAYGALIPYVSILGRMRNDVGANVVI
jgi:hypothetical protein